MAPVSPTTERAPSETRSRILAATVRLVGERADAITIQDVVKEAGVALQTFYRAFNGKDELWLAAIADLIRAASERFWSDADGIDDPLQRIRCHITSVVGELRLADDGGASARFIATERTRLAGLFPEAATRADQPIVDLFETEIRAANRAGQARSADPARDAFFITQLVMSVYRDSAFRSVVDASLADEMWRFCLRALAVVEEPVDEPLDH
jgi:TetR/AcrR family transcriptional regulator